MSYVNLPTPAQVRNTRFAVRLDGEMSIWTVQEFEWNNVWEEAGALWLQGPGVYFRLSGAPRVARSYIVTRIKRFSADVLYRTEWIGDGENAPKSKSNVLHVPTFGMLLRFGDTELLKIQTLCNNQIKCAVPDVLSARTRICLRCDRVRMKMA